MRFQKEIDLGTNNDYEVHSWVLSYWSPLSTYSTRSHRVSQSEEHETIEHLLLTCKNKRIVFDRGIRLTHFACIAARKSSTGGIHNVNLCQVYQTSHFSKNRGVYSGFTTKYSVQRQDSIRPAISKDQTSHWQSSHSQGVHFHQMGLGFIPNE